MHVIETERLSLRRLTIQDAPFIFELLNEPTFTEYLGDRGIRTIDDAQRYIANVPVASYERFGFGLYGVELKGTDVLIGMCGLLKRDYMEDVDIGYAFLRRYWSSGYAYEAAAATMDYALNTLGLPLIVGIVDPGNASSIQVLERLGMQFERMIAVPDVSGERKLFAPRLKENTI